MISVVFRPQNYTVQQHRDVFRRLKESGNAAPPGRLHHQALARGDDIPMVVDVWESPEQLQAFAQHLMPILSQIGVNPGEPEIYETIMVDEAAGA